MSVPNMAMTKIFLFFFIRYPRHRLSRLSRNYPFASSQTYWTVSHGVGCQPAKDPSEWYVQKCGYKKVPHYRPLNNSSQRRPKKEKSKKEEEEEEDRRSPTSRWF